MPEGTMTAEDALGRIADITEKTQPLRVRTEGLTLVVWGICIAASYLTIAVPLLFREANRAPEPVEHFAFVSLAALPLFWFAVSTLTTIGVWRSAALSFQHGTSTPRLVLVSVAWIVLLVGTTVLLTLLEGGRPRAWHLVGWGIVIGLFAGLNPLRFTTRARYAAALVAIVALALALYGYVEDLRGPETSLLTGLGLGVPLMLAGLVLLYRG